jgi:hypothetical protein
MKVPCLIVTTMMVALAASACGVGRGVVALADQALCLDGDEVFARQAVIAAANSDALRAALSAVGLRALPIQGERAWVPPALVIADAEPFAVFEDSGLCVIVVRDQGEATLSLATDEAGVIWLIDPVWEVAEREALTQCGCSTDHGGQFKNPDNKRYFGFAMGARPVIAGVRRLEVSRHRALRISYTHDVGDDAPGCQPIP